MDLLNIIRQHKKPIIIVSSVLAAILILIMIFNVFQHKIMNTGVVYLNIAPSDSAVTIDGAEYSSGEHTLSAGSYTVDVRRDDFEPQTVDFVIEVGKDTIVTIALQPLDENNTWYADHPDDDRIYTQAADQAAEVEQAQFLERYPIMDFIPYTDTSDNPANSNRFKIDAVYNQQSLGLLVTLNTCSDYSAPIYQQAALDWLGATGVDLSQYEIKFTTLCG